MPRAAPGAAFIPIGPRGGGGRYDFRTQRLIRNAVRLNAMTYQVALAWLLACCPVTLAIPGTGRPDHLDENMDARPIVLAQEDLAELR